MSACAYEWSTPPVVAPGPPGTVEPAADHHCRLDAEHPGAHACEACLAICEQEPA